MSIFRYQKFKIWLLGNIEKNSSLYSAKAKKTLLSDQKWLMWRVFHVFGGTLNWEVVYVFFVSVIGSTVSEISQFTHSAKFWKSISFSLLVRSCLLISNCSKVQSLWSCSLRMIFNCHCLFVEEVMSPLRFIAPFHSMMPIFSLIEYLSFAESGKCEKRQVVGWLYHASLWT